ncbi:MAG: PQQ-binding-like beta-propeller repeat protein, partial [Candidatus Woesearchaeota archaeon]|nr:PQQ-binding-like beta-propeller repeat protein [Candidatus Woesearchaeota archaeon]
MLVDSLTNLTVNNSVLNSSTGFSFRLNAGTGWGIWNFTNVTFNRTTWPAGATGTLNVKWYLDAYANYSNSSPAVGVHISAWDNVTPTTPIFDAVTDGSGVIPQQVIMGYKQNGSTAISNITYYSNYTFNASVNLYTNLSQTQNMSTNRFLYFFFNNTPPTNVSLVNPSNGNATLSNRTPFFNWTAATDFDGDNITYTINITQQTCPDVLAAGLTGTNYTPASDLCIDSLFNWTVTAYDGKENSAPSAKWNFTIASTISLLFINQTTPSGEMINETNPIFANKNLTIRVNVTNVGASISSVWIIIWQIVASALNNNYDQNTLSGQSEGSLDEWRMQGRWLNHTAWDGVSFPLIAGLDNSYFTTGSGDFPASPAVANGYVYIGSGDNQVYQLNASNISQQIANCTVNLTYSNHDLAVANGYVYIGSYNGSVYQLNASNISKPKIASFKTAYNSSSEGIAVANGYAYIISSNYLYQRNASNISKQIYTFANPEGDLEASPAVANGYVYAVSVGGSFYQLNASNISKQIANFTVVDGTDSAVANGYVYVGSSDNHVYKLNAYNISQQIANFTIGSSASSSPAVANGYIYIGGFDGKVYQFNASSNADTIFWQGLLSLIGGLWQVQVPVNVSYPTYVNYTVFANNSVNRIMQMQGNFTTTFCKECFINSSGGDFTKLADCMGYINNTNYSCVLNEADKAYDMLNNVSYNIIREGLFSVINITNTNITLDCNNSIIQGMNAGVGVSVEAENSTVRNCSFRNFNYGIAVSGNFSNITGNSIWYSAIYDLNLTGRSSSTHIWLNSFYSKGVDDKGSNNAFCAADKGNFYEESLTPALGDCGQDNITYPANGTVFSKEVNTTTNISWIQQSSQNSLSYSVYLVNSSGRFYVNSTSSLSTIINFSQTMSGSYTLQVAPFDGRYNGTDRNISINISQILLA